MTLVCFFQPWSFLHFFTFSFLYLDKIKYKESRVELMSDFLHGSVPQVHRETEDDLYIEGPTCNSKDTGSILWSCQTIHTMFVTVLKNPWRSHCELMSSIHAKTVKLEKCPYFLQITTFFVLRLHIWSVVEYFWNFVFQLVRLAEMKCTGIMHHIDIWTCQNTTNYHPAVLERDSLRFDPYIICTRHSSSCLTHRSINAFCWYQHFRGH